MRRMLVALCVALCCHGFFIFLRFPGERSVDPRLTGNETIKIRLSTPAPRESEPDVPDLEPADMVEYSDPVQGVVLPVPTSQQVLLSPPVSRNQVTEPVQEEQQAVTEQFVQPQTRKKQVRPQKTTPKSTDSQPEKKVTAAKLQLLHTSKTAKAKQAQPARVMATPLYRQNPKPAYPNLARRRGQEGTVILTVLVSKDGFANQVTLHTSSGYTLLDGSALKTVKTWQFLPGREKGKPMAMEVLVPVHFMLNGS